MSNRDPIKDPKCGDVWKVGDAFIVIDLIDAFSKDIYISAMHPNGSLSRPSYSSTNLVSVFKSQFPEASFYFFRCAESGYWTANPHVDPSREYVASYLDLLNEMDPVKDRAVETLPF